MPASQLIAPTGSSPFIDFAWLLAAIFLWRVLVRNEGINSHLYTRRIRRLADPAIRRHF
jgi:hypothetical protein